MAAKKFIHVKEYIRKMPKKAGVEKKEKKLKAEYKHRVKFGAHRNLPYEEWKKWFLSD